MVTLDKFILDETYASVADLLDREARKFARKYRLDYEEVQSEVNERFMIIYLSYIPEKGEFKPWLINKIRWHLLNWLTEKVRKHKARNEQEITDQHGYRYDLSYLCDLLDCLSEDGEELVRAALDAPDDVLADLLNCPYVKERQVRDALKKHFKNRGWSEARIKRGFSEVKEAL